MAVALATDLTVKLVATLTNALDLATPKVPLEYTARFKWASGTGADQADRMWTDTRTLTASDTEDIDLAASLTDGLGNTITFARIKMLLVAADADNTNNVLVAREATNGVPLFSAAEDELIVPPGGMFLWVAPEATAIAVTADTGDLLTITNSAGSTSVSYDIVIIGASA